MKCSDQLRYAPSRCKGRVSWNHFRKHRYCATFTTTSIGAVPLAITGLTSSDINFSLTGCITTLSQGQSCIATVVYTAVNNSGLQGRTGLLRSTDLGRGMIAMATLLFLLNGPRRKPPASLALLCGFLIAPLGRVRFGRQLRRR